tara:strand:+ start:413 stop:661 length:249 start_codon:yes stop_codon:yes gene_type:complete
MKAKVYIRLKDEILDPEGLTIQKALNSIGFDSIKSVKSGKVIDVDLSDSLSIEEAKEIIEKSCNQLLVNPNTETYTVEIIDA